MDRNKKNKRNPDFSTIVYGKLPPQSKDMEESVLGAIMTVPSDYDIAARYLTADCFYVDAHQRIFRAIESLKNKNSSHDILSVCEELRASEELEMVGGPYYVTRLTNSVMGLIENHCKIVYQKYVQREIIRVSGEMIGRAYDDIEDPFLLLGEAIDGLDRINMKTFGGMTPMDSVLVDAIKKIEYWRTLDSTVTGVPSGFEKLDKITRGWQDGDLILLAARPSKGKTALMLNLLKTAANYFGGKKSAKVWSLEMKAVRLALRMLAAASEENLWNIQTGRLNDEQLKKIYTRGIQVLSRLKIFFDDVPGADMRQIRAKGKKKDGGVETGIIFVDYLQLVTPSGDENNREQEISKISRGLKNLAQSLNIPVIALSQLSREIEKRNSKVPQLSDLRESGSLEQDADVVIFIWGPTDDEIAMDNSIANKIYLKVAKQRDGMLETIELNFKPEYQLITDSGFLPELPGNWKPAPIDFTAPLEKEETQ